jgi:hypothetical protein
MADIYSINVGKTAYTIYQSEGSSRYNVRRGKKFVRGYKTYEEARNYVDNQAKPKRSLV